MAYQLFSACAIAILFLCGAASPLSGQVSAQRETRQDQTSQSLKIAAPKQSAPGKQPSPEDELQQAISKSGNDRAALVRNLEAFLKQYPDSRQRPQIYRALVEACLQLRDNTRAADYAEDFAGRVGHRKKTRSHVRTHVARKARTEIERCSFRSERLRGQLRDPP